MTTTYRTDAPTDAFEAHLVGWESRPAVVIAADVAEAETVERVARALWEFDQPGATPWVELFASSPSRNRYMARAAAALAAMPPADEALREADGDEHHTLDELYEYRMLYNAHAANQWARNDTYPVVKSWRHSDGELCFGGGWFIVVATLPGGQAANHYAAEHWDVFAVPEVGLPPEYDGHTPRDAADRLRAALAPS